MCLYMFQVEMRLQKNLQSKIRNIGDVSIDTNIYRYFDDALDISKTNDVIISPESLEVLERPRKEFSVKIAERHGIKFKKMDSYNVNVFDKTSMI